MHEELKSIQEIRKNYSLKNALKESKSELTDALGGSFFIASGAMVLVLTYNYFLGATRAEGYYLQIYLLLNFWIFLLAGLEVVVLEVITKKDDWCYHYYLNFFTSKIKMDRGYCFDIPSFERAKYIAPTDFMVRPKTLRLAIIWFALGIASTICILLLYGALFAVLCAAFWFLIWNRIKKIPWYFQQLKKAENRYKQLWSLMKAPESKYHVLDTSQQKLVEVAENTTEAKEVAKNKPGYLIFNDKGECIG